MKKNSHCMAMLLGFMLVLSGCGGGGSSASSGAESNPAVGGGGNTTAATCGGVGADSPSIAGATLVLLVGGTEAGVSYDQLQVDGNARLGGTLQVVFEDGYTPLKGQSFTVVKAACIAGRFDSVTANRGVALTTSQDAGTVTVVVQ